MTVKDIKKGQVVSHKGMILVYMGPIEDETHRFFKIENNMFDNGKFIGQKFIEGTNDDVIDIPITNKTTFERTKYTPYFVTEDRKTKNLLLRRKRG